MICESLFEIAKFIVFIIAVFILIYYIIILPCGLHKDVWISPYDWITDPILIIISGFYINYYYKNNIKKIN